MQVRETGRKDLHDFFYSANTPTCFKLLLSLCYAKKKKKYSPQERKRTVMPGRMSFRSLSGKSSLYKLAWYLYAKNWVFLPEHMYQLVSISQNLPWKYNCMQQLYTYVLHLYLRYMHRKITTFQSTHFSSAQTRHNRLSAVQEIKMCTKYVVYHGREISSYQLFTCWWESFLNDSEEQTITPSNSSSACCNYSLHFSQGPWFWHVYGVLMTSSVVTNIFLDPLVLLKHQKDTVWPLNLLFPVPLMMEIKDS